MISLLFGWRSTRAAHGRRSIDSHTGEYRCSPSIRCVRANLSIGSTIFLFHVNGSKNVIRRNSKQFSVFFFLHFHTYCVVCLFCSRTLIASEISKAIRSFITYGRHTHMRSITRSATRNAQRLERNRATTIARFAAKQKSRSNSFSALHLLLLTWLNAPF